MEIYDDGLGDEWVSRVLRGAGYGWCRYCQLLAAPETIMWPQIDRFGPHWGIVGVAADGRWDNNLANTGILAT